MNTGDFDLIARRLKAANMRAIYPAQRACLYDLMINLSQEFSHYFSSFDDRRFYELTGFSQDMMTFNRQQAPMERPPEPPIGGSPLRGRPPPPINWAEMMVPLPQYIAPDLNQYIVPDINIGAETIERIHHINQEAVGLAEQTVAEPALGRANDTDHG